MFLKLRRFHTTMKPVSQSWISAPQRHTDFKVFMVESCKTYHKVKDRRLLWIFDFFFKKMLSFVKYPYIAAPSCHLYSYLSPSPFCLWVSDSSSLPVTARCLDFELVLFTPLSVVVVVIVVALRQTGRCNGKLRLSLNSRLQRLVFRLAGYFQRKSLVWRTGFFVYHQGWERNLVDLLTHFWHFYWFL